MRDSILTPRPPDSQPGSPLFSAFRPIQPQESDVVHIPVTRPTPMEFRTFRHPERKEKQPVTDTQHTPGSFSHAQQMEIDRQVALRLQEMEIARLHEKEPNSERPDNKFAKRQNSAQTRTEYGPTVPMYSQPGESASVESPPQHQRAQHLPHHQQTPVSRNTKKGSTKPKACSKADPTQLGCPCAIKCGTKSQDKATSLGPLCTSICSMEL